MGRPTSCQAAHMVGVKVTHMLPLMRLIRFLVCELADITLREVLGCGQEEWIALRIYSDKADVLHPTT